MILGTIQGQFQPAGSIPGKIDSFLNEGATPITFRIPPFKKTHQPKQEPTSNCFVNTNCGYWEVMKYRSFDDEPITKQEDKHVVSNKLSNMRNKSLNTLYIYGDSQGRRFFRSIIGHALCTKLFSKCDHTYTWTYKHFSPDSHDDKFKYTGDDFNETRVIETIKMDILRNEMRNPRSVFVINFGIHPTMTLPFKRAFHLFDSFVKMLKELRVKYRTDELPLVIWKTTTLPVLENAKFWNLTNFRFLTKQVRNKRKSNSNKIFYNNLKLLSIQGKERTLFILVLVCYKFVLGYIYY